MAASQISTPNVGTVDLATDEIADRHFQGTKVYGGGEGVANELVVDDRGAIRRPSIEAVAGSAFVSGLVEAVAYAAGDVVGDPAEIEGIPNGLYSIRNLAIAVAGGGASFPGEIVVYLIPHDPATPPAYGTDSAPFVPDDARLFAAVDCPVEPSAYPQIATFRPTTDVLVVGQPLEAAGTTAAGDVFDLQVLVVTRDGGAEISVAPGLAIDFLAELVGPLPGPLVPAP